MTSEPTGSDPSLSAVFKAYDIRGTVPDELDAAKAFAIGRGFARFVAERETAERTSTGQETTGPRVVIGRDMRASGVDLSRAFAEGVIEEGFGVVDVGLASTDLLYFASGRLDLAGAMVTASHNPANYNGIKCCLPGARPVGQDTGLDEVRRYAEEVLGSGPERGGWAHLLGAGDGPSPEGTLPAGLERIDMLDEFAAHVRSFVDLGKLRPLRVVADTANGMGGLTAPKVFEGLPFELEILYGDLDGTFPNHPADPIQAENLADLEARVVASRADVGLAFDGDADRVFLVDELGQPLSGSLTTSIVASSMLTRHPGATILYNLICSKAVPEIIAERGGVGERTRVGHSFIKAVMAETGAVFGGEHSGHYYFRDNFRADSGLVAALVVLEVLSVAGEPLSQLRKAYERYVDSGEINTEVRRPLEVIEAVAARYGTEGASLDDLDGLTADLGSWWFNLRPSNTEPLLRLNLEASSAVECDARVAEVLELVGAVDSELRAPATKGG